MTATFPDPSHDDTGPCQEVNSNDVLNLVKTLNSEQGGMIALLNAIQAHYGYLPEKALRIVSQQTAVSLVDLYSIATFYRSFSLKPCGKHLVLACLGTACHVRGARTTAEEIEHQLGIRAGETTPDKEFTFETVNCLGACALGPVVVIDGRYYSKVRKQRVKQLLYNVRKGQYQSEDAVDPRLFPICLRCPRCDHSLMDDTVVIEGHDSIQLNCSFDHRGDNRVWFSSVYGSTKCLAEYEIPLNTVVTFICPYCHASLNDLPDCPDCGAPIVSMAVEGGGILRICSRHGCSDRMLDLA